MSTTAAAAAAAAASSSEAGAATRRRQQIIRGMDEDEEATIAMRGQLREQLRKKMQPASDEPGESHATAATSLLERRREMFEVQLALESQQAEYARFQELQKQREAGLEQKDLKLQDSLLRFNKHLQEHSHKRQRAERKTAETRKQREAKDGELASAAAALERLRQQRIASLDSVERLRRYHRFLGLVVQAGEYFHDVSDVMNRHTALQQTEVEQHERSAKLEAALLEARSRLAALEADKQTRVLDLANTLAQLQARAERLGIETSELLRSVEQQVARTRERADAVGRTQLAIHNLGQRVRSVSRIQRGDARASYDPRDLGDCRLLIRFLGDYIGDLRHAVKSTGQ